MLDVMLILAPAAMIIVTMTSMCIENVFFRKFHCFAAALGRKSYLVRTAVHVMHCEK